MLPVPSDADEHANGVHVNGAGHVNGMNGVELDGDGQASIQPAHGEEATEKRFCEK